MPIFWRVIQQSVMSKNAPTATLQRNDHFYCLLLLLFFFQSQWSHVDYRQSRTCNGSGEHVTTREGRDGSDEAVSVCDGVDVLGGGVGGSLESRDSRRRHETCWTDRGQRWRVGVHAGVRDTRRIARRPLRNVPAPKDHALQPEGRGSESPELGDYRLHREKQLRFFAADATAPTQHWQRQTAALPKTTSLVWWIVFCSFDAFIRTI